MLAGVLLVLAAIATPAVSAPGAARVAPRALPPKPAGAPAGAFRVTIHPDGDKTKCLRSFTGFGSTNIPVVFPCDLNDNENAKYWFVMYGPTFIQNADSGLCFSLGSYKTGTTGFVPPAPDQWADSLECPAIWPQMGEWSNDPLPTKWNLHEGLLDLSNLGQYCYTVTPPNSVGPPHACDGSATKWTYQEWW